MWVQDLSGLIIRQTFWVWDLKGKVRAKAKISGAQ